MVEKPDASDMVPRPDPTKLTTDAVNAAKVEIEKLFDVKLAVIEERFRVIEEKFRAVEAQFVFNRTALDDALSAAKEASDKTEVFFTKQIDAVGGKINDMKDRLGAIESYSKGVAGSWGFIAGAGGLAIAVVTLVVLFVKTAP
jgi:hypothetical protein